MTTPDNKRDATLALVNCWNEIGVAGDQSCNKLAVHVHCRNCEVYAGAAQRNLQRPVTDGYREEWAVHFRQARQAGTRDDSAALVFRVGREWLALPAALIDSVAPESAPHRVPHRANAGLLGVVNVGGKLLPCISLAGMLRIDDSDAAKVAGRHTFARLVVMQWEDQAFALPVAELHGIARYAASEAASPATTINKGLVRYLTGVLNEGGMHIGLLDAALIGHQMARLLR